MANNTKVELRVDGKLVGEYSSMIVAEAMVGHYKRTMPKWSNSTFTLYEYRVTETLVNVKTV